MIVIRLQRSRPVQVAASRLRRSLALRGLALSLDWSKRDDRLAASITLEQQARRAEFKRKWRLRLESELSPEERERLAKKFAPTIDWFTKVRAKDIRSGESS